jgi:DNA-binding response OmpR family regulator
VLICEDNLLTRKVLEITMLKMDFDVVVAGDGMQGIAQLKEEDVQLIITDINMPYNSGLELLDYVRKNSKTRIPVIVVTNINLDDTRKHAAELGADAFLPKPFDPEKLKKAVEDIGLASKHKVF